MYPNNVIKEELYTIVEKKLYTIKYTFKYDKYKLKKKHMNKKTYMPYNIQYSNYYYFRSSNTIKK